MNHNETDIGMREAKAGECVSIGKLKLENPFVLAPLAGITDAPMRRICRQMGASLTYSEMVSAKGMYYGDRKTEKLLALYDDEGPTACQIFGSELRGGEAGAVRPRSAGYQYGLSHAEGGAQR